jgi:hypothetical protein
MMLQSWPELNRTDRRRAPDDAQHRYAVPCQAPRSCDDNTVTTVVALRDKPTAARDHRLLANRLPAAIIIVFIWV